MLDQHVSVLEPVGTILESFLALNPESGVHSPISAKPRSWFGGSDGIVSAAPAEFMAAFA